MSKQIKVATCSECDAPLWFSKRPFINEQLSCPNCRMVLEVVSNNPIRLLWSVNMLDFSFIPNDYDDFDSMDAIPAGLPIR